MISVTEQIYHSGIGYLDASMIVTTDDDLLAINPEQFQEVTVSDTGEKHIYLNGAFFIQGKSASITGMTYTNSAFLGVPLNRIMLRSPAGDLSLLSGVTKPLGSTTITFPSSQFQTVKIHIL